MIRQSYTAAVERNQTWSGEFATEPFEAAWASEGIFFVRALQAKHVPADAQARVQISPDGIHWCDEGTEFSLPTRDEQVTFGRVSRFGGWLRIAGKLPGDAQLKVIAYLSLKE
jgi:hypothetical protein